MKAATRAAPAHNVVIRAAHDADMPAIQAIYAHHVSNGFGSFEEVPPDLTELIRRRADFLARGLPYLVAEVDGHVVGSSGLHPAAPALRRRHALMLGISVAPEAQRRGVGSALMAAMCDYADRWAGALRLELTVYADNAPAIALYRRFGFEVEGTHRAYAMRDGRYADALCMARLHPNPPQLPAAGRAA